VRLSSSPSTAKKKKNKTKQRKKENLRTELPDSQEHPEQSFDCPRGLSSQKSLGRANTRDIKSFTVGHRQYQMTAVSYYPFRAALGHTLYNLTFWQEGSSSGGKNGYGWG
jgi:hypothetical protein